MIDLGKIKIYNCIVRDSQSFRGEIVSGYTTRFSVEIITYWLDMNYFDDSDGKVDIVQAINDLDVHFRHGNVEKTEYEYLQNELQRKVAREEH